jgi:hypothetical protein
MTALLLLLLHVGSPDVVVEAPAGPYRLLVAVRPPQVIPGVAEIDVRAPDGDVDALEMVPLPMMGEGAKHPPTPDRGLRDPSDAKLFSGRLWLMRVGSWQVRITAHGKQGDGMVSVPVPALPQRMRGMQHSLAGVLIALGLFLVAGLARIIGASAREGQLEPGIEPGPREKRRGTWFTAGALAVIAFALAFGNWWWNAEAADYGEIVYKPLALEAHAGEKLELEIKDPGWLNRQLTNLVPDHGHLMHLFVVRVPEMDRVYHLHPDQIGPARFVQSKPTMPAGHYRLYGDIVHASGLAETAVGELDVAAPLTGSVLAGDDAEAATPFSPEIVWQTTPLRARQLTLLTFGTPADIEPYMGMMGHAAILARDGTVFAHVHPTGSVPMAAMMIANPQSEHHHAHEAQSSVSFPYAFPKPGDYRVFVQIKRAGKVETGMADVRVD